MEQTKKLGFGLMRLPQLDAEDPASIDFDEVCRMVDTFLEKGFTYFDTAYMYHNFKSEETVRRALVERHDRDSFTLATKMPLALMQEKGPEDTERIFNEQLEKCGVSYFDYYLLHNMKWDNYETAKRCGCFPYLKKMREEGKIRKLGFSFHDSPELLDQILTEHPEMEFVQLQLNYLDWESQSIQSRRCYETAVKHGKKVVVMEPVKGGTLANVPGEAEMLFKAAHPDWSPASWAIRFAASREEVMMVLSGMSNMEQLLDNTGYMADFTPLNAEENRVIEKVTEAIRSSIAIPCTGCSYCVDGCPMKIAIPKYFELYNAEKRAPRAGFSLQRIYYNNLSQNFGKASECVGCGQCERTCPQHLPIISYMKDVAELLETK